MKRTRKASEQVAGAASAVVYLKTGEPLVDQLTHTQEAYIADIQRLFSWYQANMTQKDAKRYLVDYFKKVLKDTALAEKVAGVPDRRIPTTYGWLARFISRGAQLSDEHVQKVVDWAKELQDDPQDNTQAKVKKKVDVQAAMLEIAREHLGVLEGEFDEVCLQAKSSTQVTALDAKEVTSRVPATYIPHVKKWAQGKMAEFIEVYKAPAGSDLAEGYSNFSASALKQILLRLKVFLEALIQAPVAKKVRKPRAKKIKSAGDQIKALKYLKRSEKYDVTSVHPAEIVGAQQLWILNEKTRKVGVFKSNSTQGFQIKGTTLLNVDQEQSVGKLVRDPKTVLKKVQESGKVALRKLLDEVKSVESRLTPRLNADTILLRVVK